MRCESKHCHSLYKLFQALHELTLLKGTRCPRNFNSTSDSQFPALFAEIRTLQNLHAADYKCVIDKLGEWNHQIHTRIRRQIFVGFFFKRIIYLVLIVTGFTEPTDKLPLPSVITDLLFFGYFYFGAYIIFVESHVEEISSVFGT